MRNKSRMNTKELYAEFNEPEVGILRCIDMLGRITIPSEFREYMGIGQFDPVDIRMHENGIISIRKPKRTEE